MESREKDWSCELEQKAQKLIQTCPDRVDDLGSTGANNIIYTVTGQRYYPDVKDLIDKTLNNWWEPTKNYRLGQDNTYPGGQLFSVANIINSDTTQFGCAYNVCGRKEDLKKKVKIFCLYDEVAYMTGKSLYDTGKPCTKPQDCITYRNSKCDKKTGLCVKPEEKPGMLIYIVIVLLFRSRVAKGQAEDKLSKTKFAPKGKSMLKLVATMRCQEYDCKLEKTAADYARRCIYEHSKDYERDHAGENLYMVTIPNADKTKAGEWATRGWFSELKEFGVGEKNLLTLELWNRKYKNPKVQIGHYTQMVWGTTSKIGCGIQHCRNPNKTLVVCHYKEAGNVFVNGGPPKQIYEVGRTCSSCPDGYTCDEDKLCALIRR
ncbi:SCP-like protein [Ancylostoma duodenale]|uniref:SCP-like protein n=1 Tax=Ancylostoma duodenale TaxID=51022 RepID=A0A0C2CVB6_9BILA|nr:SCP-like protein [Ancylostoma duodenale]